MTSPVFRCFLVEKDAAGCRRAVVERTLADLPTGDVLLAVRYSSLNFKDALAAEAHPGVVRTTPHVPGIDVAGEVLECGSGRFRPGEPVLITGYELGSGQWGGWSERVRAPDDWVVPLPAGLTLRETMILGTAGFTAAQCVEAIIRNGIQPQDGEVLVTGATGGVGCLAVKLLSKLGYAVTASTGKEAERQRLLDWGAAEVIPRQPLSGPREKPLFSARWAAAVDTVGGETLTSVIRQTKPYGVVAACGLVGGTELPLTVHPFLLRGVILAGIASAPLPLDRRLAIWRKLAGEWKLTGLEELASSITLEELEPALARIKAGEVVGRTLVSIS